MQKRIVISNGSETTTYALDSLSELGCGTNFPEFEVNYSTMSDLSNSPGVEVTLEGLTVVLTRDELMRYVTGTFTSHEYRVFVTKFGLTLLTDASRYNKTTGRSRIEEDSRIRAVARLSSQGLVLSRNGDGTTCVRSTGGALLHRGIAANTGALVVLLTNCGFNIEDLDDDSSWSSHQAA